MNNNHPKVSVIVPNYNYAQFLKLRLDSILNQNFQDFELILLDDASTDNSKQILLEYQKNSHVTVLEINKENSGSPFKQWYKGLEIAKGEYIWIAESDDLAEFQFLSNAVRIMNSHPNAALCFVGSILIDEKGEILRKDINKWKKTEKEYAIFNGRQYAIQNLYWRCYIANASSVLFRKASFDRVKSKELCTNMRYGGDWLFWFNLSLQGDIIEVYHSLNYFRQHTQKVTNEGIKTGRGILDDIKIIAHMNSSLPELSNYKKRIRHGWLYNRILKLPISNSDKQILLTVLKEQLHAGIQEYWLERINRFLRFFCPFIITMKRDRLFP